MARVRRLVMPGVPRLVLLHRGGVLGRLGRARVMSLPVNLSMILRDRRAGAQADHRGHDPRQNKCFHVSLLKK